MKVDFVIPWVDGSDPVWRAQKRKYQPESERETDDGDCRYRDWGILKYWFRSVEKNAPWVDRIHFITCGQIPPFLNVNHPKLHIVNHTDYIPQSYLPTFSSHCIELNMHRIEGLSEHFIYFNDDTFLNCSTEPEMFFQQGKPCYYLMYRKMNRPDETDGSYEHARYHDAEAVYRHFRRYDALKKNPLNVFHPCYGLKTIIWNLYMLPKKHLVDFMDLHVSVPILKSTMEQVWKSEKELLESTSSHRFRTNEDVNQFIFRYWDLARGNFVPCKPDSECYGINSRSIDAIEREITDGLHTLICLNDDEHCDDFKGCKVRLLNAFEKRYPELSSFEK